MFFPSIEVCLMNGPLLHGKDVLQLQRGQWVHCQGAKGRLLCTKTLDVIWRFSGESFASFNLRFRVSCERYKPKKRIRVRTPKALQHGFLFSLPRLNEEERDLITSHDYSPCVVFQGMPS